MKKLLTSFFVCLLVFTCLTACSKKKNLEDMTLEELKTENIVEYYNRIDLTDVFKENSYLRISIDKNGVVSKGYTRDGVHYSYKEYTASIVEKWETVDYVYASYINKNTNEALKIKYTNDSYSSDYSKDLIRYVNCSYQETLDGYDLVNILASGKTCTAYFDANTKELSKVECPDLTLTYEYITNSIDLEGFQEVSILAAYDIDIRYID